MATVERWTGIVAGEYYKIARAALKAADPDALFLGDRLPIYYDPAAIRAEAEALRAAINRRRTSLGGGDRPSPPRNAAGSNT